MRLLMAAAVGALLAGCGGGDGSPANCAAPAGTYQLAIVPASPNGCQLSAGTVVVPAGTVPFAGASCNAQVTTSADMCTTDVVSTCPDDTGSSSATGHIEWNAAATHATGVLTYAFTPTGSTTPCVSTVNVMYSQL